MIYISFKVACRNCYKTDDTTRMYTLQNATKEEFLKRTEYSVMKTLERWRSEDGHTCPFCSSSDNEIMDIEIDNEKLYNFEDLCLFYGTFLFAINIQKDGGMLTLRTGGSSKVETSFLKQALRLIISTIQEPTSDLFEIKQDGHFFICLTGGVNIHTSKEEIQIQRLKHAGISQKEIVNEILALINRSNIDL